MSIINHDTHPTAHPEWCVSPFCESPHPHDFRHSSVPVLVETSLDDVEITLNGTVKRTV